MLEKKEEVKRMKALRMKVLRERLERIAGKEDVDFKGPLFCLLLGIR